MKSAPFSYFVLMMLMMLICWHSANTFAAETLCVDCEVHKLQNDIQNDRIAVAIARLKNLKTRFPNRREPVLLLANAYAADGNDYWALNVLYEWYDTHPDDCEAVSFIVWQHIQMANTDDAKALMAQNKCSQNDAMTTRWHILDAYLKTLNGNQPEIKTNLPDTWPEDALMWKMLFEKGAVG
ncbi:MAG: hypothetical protein JXX14_03385, partial [Deltaproteobacteria bacterium]|nr:hypothetical protein [Deltaproteobacteria bacterium]